MAIRDLQLVLFEDGGAELVDVDTDQTLWASDSDEDFGEEFPDLLEESDVEALQDYLEQHGVCTARELETMEIVMDTGEDPDDEDDDDEEDPPWADGDDVIDVEVIEHE